ncbi:MAG: acetyl-CoA carboxylase biotin carboxyl carrier protein subunit [Alphaproteobacteria bacterium]|nr:acetyl-CoA carboxylase biotin carboxyl carrier protein subunit [Alphaproteobacteria bacterium]
MSRRTLQSEITGKVWKIEAAPGDRIGEDSTILILESMKMEIPILAPIDCTLIELLVEEGEAVKEGQAVAIIEE